MNVASDRNRAICLRFQEENYDVEWSDSDVSESELVNVLGDLRAVNELAAAANREDRLPQGCRQRQGTLPLHLVFVVDSSASMATNDVNGKTRLNAVFDACEEFVEKQEREDADKRDRYSLISFNKKSKCWCSQADATKTKESFGQARNELKPLGDTRFTEAFKEISQQIGGEGIRGANQDVRVLLLSDGKPQEATRGANAVVEALRTHLLSSQMARRVKQLIIYTVGFGSCSSDFESFLKPLSQHTGGTFQAADLSEIELSRAFGTVVTSITTTRTTWGSTPKQQGCCTQDFDSEIVGPKCVRICDISRLKRKGKRRFDKSNQEATFEIDLKKKGAVVTVNATPFDHGGMRLVYEMVDTFNGECTTMVAKRLLFTEHADEKDMLAFCKNSETAICYRNSFQHDLKRKGIMVSLFFVPCYLYSYNRAAKTKYFVGEQFLDGDFIKFNGNNGYVNTSHELSETMQAFSHYTFVKSRSKHIVVDLQGAVDNNTILLTDPQVLSRDERGNRQFGPGDLGLDGIKAFFEGHVCGPTCEALGLKQQQEKLYHDLNLEQRRCIICADAPRKTVLEPCGHSLTCIACAEKLLKDSAGKCPTCRVRITGHSKGVFSATYVQPHRRRTQDDANPKDFVSSIGGRSALRMAFHNAMSFRSQDDPFDVFFGRKRQASSRTTNSTQLVVPNRTEDQFPSLLAQPGPPRANARSHVTEHDPCPSLLEPQLSTQVIATDQADPVRVSNDNADDSGEMQNVQDSEPLLSPRSQIRLAIHEGMTAAPREESEMIAPAQRRSDHQEMRISGGLADDRQDQFPALSFGKSLQLGMRKAIQPQSRAADQFPQIRPKASARAADPAVRTLPGFRPAPRPKARNRQQH